MTGEPKRDDEPDFLDDFILEDVPAGKDLESLFDSPAAGATAPGSPQEQTAPQGEDALFTDHSQGLVPSEKFEGGPPFSETGSSTWKGEALELDTPGAGKRGAGSERDAGKAKDGDAGPAELDSLLNAEDEFSIETDQELQIDETDDSLLDAAANADETVVLDEGAGTWQADASADPSQADAEGPESEAAAAGEQMPLEVAAEDTEVEPGWEPLPATSMDQLSEVGGVERVEGEGAGENEEAWEAEAEAGQEIYADGVAEAAGVVGGRRRVPVFRLVASLAASLAIVAAAALLVWRPEWLGLHAESEQVASVQVQRPRLEIAVAAPPMPLPEVDPAVTPGADPTGTAPGTGNGTPSVVTAEPPPVVPTPPVDAPVPPSPTTPVVATGEVPGVVNVPAPVDVQKDWPVPVAIGTSPNNPLPVAPGLREGLVRVGEDMLVGTQAEGGAIPVDGVMPGSKAFAQLHNGNYFIGSVKATDPECITLRLPSGEITLARAGLAKLTALGSSDYEELQRVTSGFVRLTNNNRLVGSILSSIADDHIVLEFRSNRVMLPKSAIGEVVQGEGEGGVRLGTTREEDDWVRQLSERQLGTVRHDLPDTGAGTSPGRDTGAGTNPGRDTGADTSTDADTSMGTGAGAGTRTSHVAPPAPPPHAGTRTSHAAPPAPPAPHRGSK